VSASISSGPSGSATSRISAKRNRASRQRLSRRSTPRIVLFAQGEEGRSPLSLEYPDRRDTPDAVRGLMNGRPISVPAAIVRRFLNCSRTG